MVLEDNGEQQELDGTSGIMVQQMQKKEDG
jgi:hypothetical protein